jgi:23S rRNA (uracil1939-C5)-methyltransferase
VNPLKISYKGLHIERDIHTFIYPGFGVTEWEGKPVWVRGVYPGERAEIKLIKRYPAYYEAKCVELIKSSPIRSSAVCRHFGQCGGCQSLDLAYSDQLRLKTRMLEEYLNLNFSSLKGKVLPVLPSASSTYYRNKMDFSFGRSEDGRVIVGLKERGHFDKVLELNECFLHDPITPHILAWTADFFDKRGCTVWDYHQHTGLLRHLVIRQSKTDGNFLVILVASDYNEPLFKAFAEGLSAAFPAISGILYGINATVADTSYVSEVHVLKGKSTLFENLCDLRFELSPQAFFQTNTHQADVLYRTIVDYADVKPDDLVFDLYCGTGTIGLALSANAKAVVGVDENLFSIEDAKKNATLNGINHVEFSAQNVRHFLKSCTQKPGVVVVDPPRDGLIPKALKRVVELQAPRLVYVSCHFSSLIRDLTVISERYNVEAIQPVDMFPNTWHVETVVQLTLKPGLN